MSIQQHNRSSLTVSDVERARAEERLKQAFVEGRLDRHDFDHRVGQVMVARSRNDLDYALMGLPQMRANFLPAPEQKNTGLAAVGHFSFFVFWLFGPLMTWAVSPEKSYARAEAAKAFNFQLVSFVLGVAGLMISAIFDVGMLWGVGALIWLVLTIVGGVKAAQGEDWVNPVMRVVPWNVLKAPRR